MSNYDPPQQPWGGPPQDPYGGAPQYPPQQPGGFPPPTQAFPPGGGGYPPVSGGGGYPPVSGGGYPPPADPYGGGFGQQDPYGQGGYGQTAYGQPAYGQPGGYGQPTPPRSGGGAKIALIIAGVVLLALCGGGIFTAYKLTSDDSGSNGNQANPTTTAAPTGTGTGTGTGTRTATPTNTATTDGGGGSNPDNFRKGDCFVNDGTESDPEVRKVPCTTAGAYEVIAKVNFTTDEKRCDDRVLGAGTGNWNASYVMDKSPGSTGDYVLCLKKR